MSLQVNEKHRQTRWLCRDKEHVIRAPSDNGMRWFLRGWFPGQSGVQSDSLYVRREVQRSGQQYGFLGILPAVAVSARSHPRLLSGPALRSQKGKGSPSETRVCDDPYLEWPGRCASARGIPATGLPQRREQTGTNCCCYFFTLVDIFLDERTEAARCQALRLLCFVMTCLSHEMCQIWLEIATFRARDWKLLGQKCSFCHLLTQCLLLRWSHPGWAGWFVLNMGPLLPVLVSGTPLLLLKKRQEKKGGSVWYDQNCI